MLSIPDILLSLDFTNLESFPDSLQIVVIPVSHKEQLHLQHQSLHLPKTPPLPVLIRHIQTIPLE
jgi:hypothetical protein